MKRALLGTGAMLMALAATAPAQPGRGWGPRWGSCMQLAQQPAGKAPIASSPVVDLSGTISKVSIQRGQGMPFLEVKNAAGTTVVRLGSIRYLMEQNFNPKAGEEIAVKGYSVNGDVVAITARLVAENREIRLRDDNGWPLWRGGGPRGRRP